MVLGSRRCTCCRSQDQRRNTARKSSFGCHLQHSTVREFNQPHEAANRAVHIGLRTGKIKPFGACRPRTRTALIFIFLTIVSTEISCAHLPLRVPGPYGPAHPHHASNQALNDGPWVARVDASRPRGSPTAANFEPDHGPPQGGRHAGSQASRHHVPGSIALAQMRFARTPHPCLYFRASSRDGALGQHACLQRP
ncbi:hypothetical protein D3C85_992210 [compost metagenome]